MAGQGDGKGWSLLDRICDAQPPSLERVAGQETARLFLKNCGTLVKMGDKEVEVKIGEEVKRKKEKTMTFGNAVGKYLQIGSSDAERNIYGDIVVLTETHMTDDVSPVSDLIGEGQALGIKVKKSGPKYNFSMAFSGDYRHGVLGRITPVGRAKGLSFWHSNNANGNGKMDLFCGLSRKTPDSVGNKLRGCAEWSMLRVDGKNVAVLIAVYLNNKLHHSEVQQLTSELTRQLQLLKDKLQDAYPGNIIFAGDFNSHGKFTGRPGLRSTTSQAFLREFIEEHNLVDVLQYAAKGYVDDGGFDPYWTAGPVTGNRNYIDRVYVSKPLLPAVKRAGLEAACADEAGDADEADKADETYSKLFTSEANHAAFVGIPAGSPQGHVASELVQAFEEKDPSRPGQRRFPVILPGDKTHTGVFVDFNLDKLRSLGVDSKQKGNPSKAASKAGPKAAETNETKPDAESVTELDNGVVNMAIKEDKPEPSKAGSSTSAGTSAPSGPSASAKKCSYCGEPGHNITRCPKRLAESAGK